MVLVNGQDIREPIAEIESRHGRRRPYMGLTPKEIFLPSRHLLGKPLDYYRNPVRAGDDGKLPILGCDCGDVNDNPIYMRVTVEGDRVIWSEFENPWRSPAYFTREFWVRESPPWPDVWSYADLGPFVFNRVQYERELTRQPERWERLKR